MGAMLRGVDTARVTAKTVRELVAAYNTQEHPDDEVLIEFPQTGRGPTSANYTPVFSYFHDVYVSDKLYENLLHRMRHAFPRGIWDAHGDLRNIYLPLSWAEPSGLCPEHLPFMMALVECSLLRCVLENDCGDLNFAGSVLAEAHVIAPHHWRTELMKASYFFFRHDKEFADSCFQNALSLNPVEVQNYGWYHAFLFATGQIERGLELAAAKFQNNTTEPLANAVYGLWLYGLGDAKSGYYFSKSFMFEESCVLGHIGSILNFITDRAGWLPLKSLRSLQNADDNYYKWIFQGLVAGVCRCVTDKELRSFLRRYMTHVKAVRAADKASYTSVAELKIHAVYPFRYFQEAIEKIVNKRYAAAIDALYAAWKDEDPLIMWLHMMPVFRPLHSYERFQSLLLRRLESPTVEGS
jgi:hypothetical protein